MKLIYSHLTFRPASWPDKTYHARKGEHSYTVDWNGSEWTLRGWIESQFSVYEAGRTCSAMMKLANDLAESA